MVFKNSLGVCHLLISSDPISSYHNSSCYNIVGCSVVLKKQQRNECRKKWSDRKILDQSSDRRPEKRIKVFSALLSLLCFPQTHDLQSLEIILPPELENIHNWIIAILKESEDGSWQSNSGKANNKNTVHLLPNCRLSIPLAWNTYVVILTLEDGMTNTRLGAMSTDVSHVTTRSPSKNFPGVAPPAPQIQIICKKNSYKKNKLSFQLKVT